MACYFQSCQTHLWEYSPLGEHPEGASRGKGQLTNQESMLVCQTWSSLAQARTPCGGQRHGLMHWSLPTGLPHPAVLLNDKATSRIQAGLSSHCIDVCWKPGSWDVALLGTDSRGYPGRHKHSCWSREFASCTRSACRHAAIQDSEGREKPPGMQSMSRRTHN